MSRVTIDDTLLKNMANAIRTKDGSTELFGVDTFENKILNIPSGGECNAKYSYGSFTIPTDGMTEITIEHGLGVIPNFIEVHGISKYSNGSTERLQICLMNSLSNVNNSNYYIGTAYNNNFRGGAFENIIGNVNEETFDIIPNSRALLYATTYYWTAIYFETNNAV